MIGYFCALACSAALTIGSFGNVVLRATYVDDTAPRPCQIVAQDLATGWPMVIAGVPQGIPRATCHNVGPDPRVIYALEWYPFGGVALGRVPCGHQAYILQDTFAWPGQRPPTARQRAAELAQAQRCAPELIFEF